MRKVVTAVLGLMVVGAVLFSSVEKVEARAQYKKAFETKYEDVKKKNKITCNACHGKKKSIRNNYGKALEKSFEKIPEKGEKDKKKIEAALTKAEKEKSAIDGKTFGDLLKDGKLPASEK